MIGQVTASALVSENKTLCHPASVDTIATCAGYEDHVSMSGWAARKALMVIENVERILVSNGFLQSQTAFFLLFNKSGVTGELIDSEQNCLRLAPNG